jgi:hypothetical protein
MSGCRLCVSYFYFAYLLGVRFVYALIAAPIVLEGSMGWKGCSRLLDGIPKSWKVVHIVTPQINVATTFYLLQLQRS